MYYVLYLGGPDLLSIIKNGPVSGSWDQGVFNFDRHFSKFSLCVKFSLTRLACGIICNVANNSAERMISKPPPYRTQLSPAIILMSGVAHDGGIVQGVRIWFRANCGGWVFGDMANFSSEIG